MRLKKKRLLSAASAFAASAGVFFFVLLPVLIDRRLHGLFADEGVALIMGGNVVRFLCENLPPS